MSDHREVLIDVSGILDIETLHEAFYKELELMPGYGFNFDALWDCINDPELSNMPRNLRVEGLADLKRNLPKAHAKVVSCFRDYASENPDKVVIFEDLSPSGRGLDIGDPIGDV